MSFFIFVQNLKGIFQSALVIMTVNSVRPRSLVPPVADSSACHVSTATRRAFCTLRHCSVSRSQRLWCCTAAGLQMAVGLWNRFRPSYQHPQLTLKPKVSNFGSVIIFGLRGNTEPTARAGSYSPCTTDTTHSCSSGALCILCWKGS